MLTFLKNIVSIVLAEGRHCTARILIIINWVVGVRANRCENPESLWETKCDGKVLRILNDAKTR